MPKERPVNQYTLEGKYITTFQSVKEATQQTGANNICLAARTVQHSGGYQWKYDTGDHSDILSARLRRKYSREDPVCQYLNEDLTLIRRYDSPTEAEKTTGIEANEIKKSCLNPMEYDIEKRYLWIWESDRRKIHLIWNKRHAEEPEEKQTKQTLKPKKTHPRVHDSNVSFPVNQYKLDGEYVRTFENVLAARKANPGLKKMQGFMLQKRNTKKIYGGYQWRIDTGDHSDLPAVTMNQVPQPKNKKAIRQIDIKDRHVVATYDSLMDAERATGVSHEAISRCCYHPRFSAKGYYWEFIEETQCNKTNRKKD